MMIETVISSLAGLFLQGSLLPEPIAAAPQPIAKQGEQRIGNGVERWRFTTPFYDRARQTYVCRTSTSSGDRQADRAFCQAMVICHNRYKDEHFRLLNMTGDIAAIHNAAREFRQRRDHCFRSEAAPLVSRLTAERTR